VESSWDPAGLLPELATVTMTQQDAASLTQLMEEPPKENLFAEPVPHQSIAVKSEEKAVEEGTEQGSALRVAGAQPSQVALKPKSMPAKAIKEYSDLTKGEVEEKIQMLKILKLKLLERKKSSANLGADADETQAYDASPIAKSILNSSEPIDLLESDEEGDGDETVRKCLAGQLSAAASEQGELAYPGGLDLEDSQFPKEFPPAPMDPPALGGNGASAEQPKAEVSRTALPPSEEAWSLKDSEKPDASEVVKREEAKIDPTKSTGEVPLGEEGKED
ncbi:unnamed protein product, partial [Durusdinium trenchii]